MKKLGLIAVLVALIIIALQIKNSLRAAPASAALQAATRLPSGPQPTAKTDVKNPGVPLKNAELTENVKEVVARAEQLENNSPAAAASESQMAALAQQLTRKDAEQLKSIAMTSERGHSLRFLAVYLLSQRPEEFVPQLEEIAGQRSEALSAAVAPHTRLEMQRHFEESVHVQAMSALEKLNLQGNQEKAFFTGLEDHPNPLIRKLARMGALGADTRQTIINQYINASL